MEAARVIVVWGMETNFRALESDALSASSAADVFARAPETGRITTSVGRARFLYFPWLAPLSSLTKRTLAVTSAHSAGPTSKTPRRERSGRDCRAHLAV